jgi:hypothetical protein
MGGLSNFIWERSLSLWLFLAAEEEEEEEEEA